MRVGSNEGKPVEARSSLLLKAERAIGVSSAFTATVISPFDPNTSSWSLKKIMANGRKPDGDPEMGEPKLKKRKVESVASIGHGSKISDRHKRNLVCLASLLPQKKTELRATNKMETLLQDETSSGGLYMEWCDEKEAYLVYVSSQTRSAVILFEFLAAAGLEALPMENEIKNPQLVFSDRFGEGGNWGSAKMMLFELFSKSDADPTYAKDYLYAFTRSSGKIYFRIYKINPLLDADKGESWKQVLATFVLRPVEIRYSDSIDYFLNMEMFLISQGDNSLNALSSGIQHLEYSGQNNHLLPPPQDFSEWEGYTTNRSEFFSRFHAFKRTKVPGTGTYCHRTSTMTTFIMQDPEAYYWHLCLPFKVYARSLIVCVGNTFKINACYASIKEEHIFIRGKTVKILGARLVNYTLLKAISNMNSVGRLLKKWLVKMGLEKKNFPEDLKETLQMLERNPSNNNGNLEGNPVENFDIIKNSICWMDAEERIHVIDDLVQDFLYRMGHYDQLHVGEPFPSFTQWVDMCTNENFLLKACREHNLPKNKTKQELNDWTEKKRNELLEYMNNVKDDADQLYSCRKYFKTVNNALKHLLQTKFDMFKKELSPDEVDLIGSWKFAATYAHVQLSVPKALAGVDPNGRGSYKRFARFFHPDDAIQFKPHDKKGDADLDT